MAADSDNDILIIGGGVAGLVLAQGLKHRGIPFKVFERNEHLSPKSHGYRFRCEAAGLEALEETLSPEMWELLEETHAKDSPPVATLIDPYTAAYRSSLNAVQDPSPRAQRCYPIDRNWFRELCSIGIEDDIQWGKAFSSYEILGPGRVRVRFTDDTSATGRLLVAADGVHSLVRRQTFPDIKLIDTERMVLWGRTPYTPEVRAKLPELAFVAHNCAAIESDPATRSILFAAIEWPKRDFAVLSKGKLSKQDDYIFWVLSTELKPELVERNAKLEDQLRFIDEVTGKWDPALQNLFKMQNPNALSVIPVHSSTPDLPKWETDPCITFIGDSIHAMAPTGGVAGRNACEDARDLCMAIVASKDGGEEALKEQLEKYEDVMRARSAIAVEQAFRNAKMLWGGRDWWEYEKAI